MRGNKFYTKLCLVIIAILCLGAVGAVYLTPAKISKVQAEDTTKYMHSTCSQRYDDGVVFSVEQVYFGSDRTTPLYLDSGASTAITNILGYNESNNYFLNYGGLSGANHSLSKKIINNGEYAYLEENVTRTVWYHDEAEGKYKSTSLNQGIMITLGGYVFDINGTSDTKDDILHTNSETISDTSKYSSQLQSINIEMKRNGKVFTSTETTGEASLRTYNNGLYFDFVYFLDASETNEGFYEIGFTYTKEGGQTQSHSFNFYILLSSKYDNAVTVNGQEYGMAPNFTNTEVISSNEYVSSTDKEQYPVLTYDYKHYDMKYTHIHNDLVTNVAVRYEEYPNEGIERLAIDTTTNGATSTEYFNCNVEQFAGNNIVSFLFANVGEYEFEFNYVYYYNNERLVVSNLSIEDKVLNIYGFELKYAKTGFASSDLRALSVVQNGTMVIPVNGYVNSSVTANISQDLGYMYTFVDAETKEGGKKKSGDITILETADVTGKKDNFDETSNVFTDVNAFNFEGKNDFIDTDQGGLWFNLNDLYDLNDCYYIYSPTKFVNSVNYPSEILNKVTTFTKTGYYFVKAGYKTDSSANTRYQYFAFRISSGVANVKLYTTEENTIPKTNSNRLYSNQYTNQNVYATWDKPTTFASSQTATLYNTRQGYANIYETKSNLMDFAKGRANISLESNEYIQGETLISNNGSYLLEVKVNGSDAKAYYYFTIDKEDISGLEVLAISSASIGSSTIYNVTRDKDNNPITYTSKLVIDEKFTFWWDNKNSGAQISGSYTYTPIISSVVDKEKIESTEGGTDYLWLINDYTLGTTSKNISIEKPATKTSTVDPNNVLTNQGIYWFNLIDEAGNEMNYMVIVDKTEAVIKATAKSGGNVISGDMLAEDVTFEWGTHKAIQLSDDVVSDIDDESDSYIAVLKNIYKSGSIATEKYYKNENSNISSFSNSLKVQNNNGTNELYLIVANQKATINDITINKGQTSLSHNEITLTNWHNVSIALNNTEIRYVVKVYGDNQVETNDKVSYFSVTLNPDKSEGAVKSKADETESLYTKVKSYNTSSEDVKEFESKYSSGQASDDGLFVFEWVNNDGTYYEVGEVYYDYYPLMSQEDLDKYDQDDNTGKYRFYPYISESVERSIIYDKDNNNYEIDSDGTKTIYRSTVLNPGYVTYYNEAGNLVSQYATCPGMYVITRVYEEDVDISTDNKVRKYVFFVDRNNIIDYSIADVSNKIVGKYIDVLSQEKIIFDHFTGAPSKYTFGENIYKIYLQTNRLPMEIRVPTGKYASLVNNEIAKTSNSNSGKLNLKITFIDKHSLLGYKDVDGELVAPKIELFASKNVTKDNGYVEYSLTRDSLINTNDNMANIEAYLAACSQLGSDWLSLPGIYIIELSDNVGKVIDDSEYNTTVSDPNVLTIGVEITKSSPVVEMYANQVPSNKDNADYADFSDEFVFNTSKAYVRYELNNPTDESFDAQVDSSYVYITRIENGEEKVYYNSETNSGEIDNTKQFFVGDVGYNYIQKVGDEEYVIWLETGLEIQNGKIISYKEYTYKVYVRYVLNGGKYTNCYVYNVMNNKGVVSTEQYYETEITVNIDRTPFLENLENSVVGQETFLEEYLNNYAEEGYNPTGNLDSKIYNTVAYRAPDGEDYYAVVNNLYYYYIDKGDYESAENSMYAIRVDKDASVTLDGSTIYYRKMYYKEGALLTESKDRRMALLPICDQYYGNVTGFDTFSEISRGDFAQVSSHNNPTWSTCLNLSENGNGYGYYEIIELDTSGNMTQYLIYVGSGAENVELTFEDVTYEYNVTLNFSGTPTIAITGRDGLIDQFSLIPFNSVTDMFDITITRDGTTGTKDITKDWFYKVNITNNNNGNYTYYLNYNNIDLAQYIFDIFSEYTDQNYTFTVTDRYNKTLTLYIDVLSEKYNLNVNEFKANKNEVDTSYWYLEPKVLNFTLGNGGIYYVDIIELTDLTDPNVPVVRFDLDKDGKIEGIYVDNESRESYQADEKDSVTLTSKGDYVIKLGSTREYQVKLIDCARKEYGPIRIYSYANGSEYDAKIEAYGEYSVKNDVYYSANPVVVTYNKNVYSNIVIDVYKDGFYVERFWDGFNVDNIIVTGEVDEKNPKNYILTFNPYTLVEGIKDVGAKLEFELSLFYNNRPEQTYKIVLDNRVPVINLLNTSGDDRSNIINVKYLNSKNNNKVSLDTNTLFGYAPTLTLSETVILDWSNFDSSIYSNNISSYYHPYLYLVEFKTKTDWTVTNLGVLNNSIKNISPNEGTLGRYVLILAFHSAEVGILEGDNVNLISDNLICYKAYVFNISSTANAMYEVQNAEGRVQDPKDYILGEDLFNVVTEKEKTSFLSKFGFVKNVPTDVEKPEGDRDDSNEWKLYDEYLIQKNKYDNFIKFIKQSIPLYIHISTDNYSLVPNGDNGIQASTFACIVSSDYTLTIYKVYSKVHTTYAAILKVAESDELVNTNTLNPVAIRFVPDSDENLTKGLIKENVITFNSYGALYFTNFNRGGVSDPSKFTGELTPQEEHELARFNLAKHNSLYLEVWYKYNDDEDGMQKVGDFFGENYIDDQGKITDYNFIKFATSGTYVVYLKDLAGNTRLWSNGTTDKEYLTITIMPEVIVSVNNEVPVDYNYYNSEVTVSVLFASSGYYDNGSIKIKAYYNGSDNEYITSKGDRNNITSYTFTEYGTYRVIIEAEVNDDKITKTIVFSIINPYEARLALDFTQISKYDITKVENSTTKADVTSQFNFLLNEGFIYSKLITYERLSASNVFGSTMGKQTFKVYYTVNADSLVPARNCSFEFTVNNQTPSLHSSIKPGDSTTKDITIKFNAQTIYRQVGDCYIVVNGTKLMSISEDNAYDGTTTLTLSGVGDYYVKIESDSGRVITSFKVTIKEPLNTMSIILIVVVVLVVVGVVVTFIILRTRMKVR